MDIPCLPLEKVYQWSQWSHPYNKWQVSVLTQWPPNLQASEAVCQVLPFMLGCGRLCHSTSTIEKGTRQLSERGWVKKSGWSAGDTITLHCPLSTHPLLLSLLSFSSPWTRSWSSRGKWVEMDASNHSFALGDSVSLMYEPALSQLYLMGLEMGFPAFHL